MVGIAQLVEHRLVVPVVAGSSPVVHPDESAPTFESGPISFSPLAVAIEVGPVGPFGVLAEMPPKKENSCLSRPQATKIPFSASITGGPLGTPRRKALEPRDLRKNYLLMLRDTF